MSLEFVSLFLVPKADKPSAADEELEKEYFRLCKVTEEHRVSEYHAAVTIQRAWRGYLVRKWREQLSDCCLAIQRVWRGFHNRKHVESIIMQRNKERRMALYNSLATKIQKTWRGYASRKNRFDYYKRKAYIEEIIRKNEELRMQLDQHQEQQKLQEKEIAQHKRSRTIDRLASNMHHLLGTKSVPGVLARPPKFAYNVDTANMDQAIRARHEKERQKLLLAEHIEESALIQSTGLKSFVKERLKSHAVSLRPPEEEITPEKAVKKAPGPFPPVYKLEKIINKPFKPTLRVQTGFYDTINAKREEQRYYESLKISKDVFVTRVHPPQPKTERFISNEPYKIEPYGTKWFRDMNKKKFVSKKDFKTIVPPIPVFDEANNI